MSNENIIRAMALAALVVVGIALRAHKVSIDKNSKRIQTIEQSVADLATAVTMLQLEHGENIVIQPGDTGGYWPQWTGTNTTNYLPRWDSNNTIGSELREPNWSLLFSNRLDGIKGPVEVICQESNRITGRFAIDYSTNYAR